MKNTTSDLTNKNSSKIIPSAISAGVALLVAIPLTAALVGNSSVVSAAGPNCVGTSTPVSSVVEAVKPSTTPESVNRVITNTTTNTNGNGAQANGNSQSNVGGLVGGANVISPVSVLNGNTVNVNALNDMLDLNLTPAVDLLGGVTAPVTAPVSALTAPVTAIVEDVLTGL